MSEYRDLAFEVLHFRSSVDRAIELAIRHGQTDGSHHKLWVIDQMVRILAGDKYEQIISEAKDGVDGPNTYEWDVGIAP